MLEVLERIEQLLNMASRFFSSRKSATDSTNSEILDGLPEPRAIYISMDESSKKAIEYLSGASNASNSLEFIYSAIEYLEPVFGTFTTVIKFLGGFIVNAKQEEFQNQLKKASHDKIRIIDATGMFRSKLRAMKNRLDEVTPNYFEAPIAACLDHADETICQLTNESLVFLEHPLGGAPCLAALCRRQARLSHYYREYMSSSSKYEPVRKRIKMQTELLETVSKKYQQKCIEMRLKGIQLKLDFDPPSDPEEWTDWSKTYHLIDFYASIEMLREDKILIDEYRNAVAERYNNCFAQLRHKIESMKV